MFKLFNGATLDQLLWILDKYNNGRPKSEIARLLNVTPNTVQEYLNSLATFNNLEELYCYFNTRLEAGDERKRILRYETILQRGVEDTCLNSNVEPACTCDIKSLCWNGCTCEWIKWKKNRNKEDK